MISNELLIDGFERVKEVVHQTVEGLDMDELTFRPSESANSIAWIVWHLARIQDDHIADIAGLEQIWHTGWSERMKLPFDEDATGFGQTSQEVGEVKVGRELLLGYYDAVHDATVAYIQALTDEDYKRVVDTSWNPPVTLAVRLVSLLSDDLQHAGQAAFVRGLLGK